MLDNRDQALVMREALLNIILLLEDSLVKTANVGSSSQEEVGPYAEMVQELTNVINNRALSEIYGEHPELRELDESKSLPTSPATAHLFSNRKLALQILDIMMSISSLISRSCRIVENSPAPEEEKVKYRKKAGQLMSIVVLEAMQDIFVDHPDLCPPERQSAVSDYENGVRKHERVE